MTDLNHLKVSLTKHGAHKVFVLLRDLETNQVISSVWDVHEDIKIDRAQARQILSAFSDETLPGFWETAKSSSETTLKHLVFLAILFSHHQVIDAFRHGAAKLGQGEIRRDEVLAGKAFTNIKNDIEELGVATHSKTKSVGYDLRPLFEDDQLGSLAKQLISIKLQYAGWSGDGSVVDEAVAQGFHRALSLEEGDFRDWIDGDVVVAGDGDAATNTTLAIGAIDPDKSEAKEFAFIQGHNPAKEGKTKRSLPREPVGATLNHNMLQTKIYAHLAEIHGAENVGTEVPVGVAANSIDVVVSLDGKHTFYEIKTRPSVRLCIREALSQLMEYAYWPGVVRSDKLVVVGEADVTNDATVYLNKLRTDFGLPVYYAKVDRADGSLSQLT